VPSKHSDLNKNKNHYLIIKNEDIKENTYLGPKRGVQPRLGLFLSPPPNLTHFVVGEKGLLTSRALLSSLVVAVGVIVVIFPAGAVVVEQGEVVMMRMEDR
jgi:hypothetical protein